MYISITIQQETTTGNCLEYKQNSLRGNHIGFLPILSFCQFVIVYGNFFMKKLKTWQHWRKTLFAIDFCKILAKKWLNFLPWIYNGLNHLENFLEGGKYFSLDCLAPPKNKDIGTLLITLWGLSPRIGISGASISNGVY